MSQTAARSQYVADDFVQPFLRPDFDPTDFLNSTLPAPSFSSANSKPGTRTAAFIALSTQMQTLLTQLNTNTTRLSNTLTQLTDEIIRSGSRLAYEVEVLHGETSSLDDALRTGLKPDLDLLSLQAPALKPSDTGPTEASTDAEDPAPATTGPEAESQSQDPEFLARLRTLTTVRERLDAVIKVFGAAMAWPVAPSELSLASSFISVSGPQDEDAGAREGRAKAYAEGLRREVGEMLASGPDGMDAANARVADLREVAGVWKGTAEEKARLKLVDGLQKLVDDRVKALGRSGGGGGGGGENRKQGTTMPVRGIDYRYGASDGSRLSGEGIGGYGFLQNLRNLKNDVYLE